MPETDQNVPPPLGGISDENNSVIQPSSSNQIQNQPLVGSPLQSSEPIAPAPVTKGKKKKLGLVAVLVIGMIVLLGGSAAAYFGIIAPNQPSGILKSAIKNTLEQTEKKVKFTSNLSFESLEENALLKAVTVKIDGQANGEKGDFQASVDATASGIKIPLELRKVDKSIFIKVGDLSGVKSAASLAEPELGGVIDQLNKKIANQWLEIDETLQKQAEGGCKVDTTNLLTKEDIDLIMHRYKEVPFATYKSSKDTVNGKAAIKYEIEIDDNKAANYTKGLEQLSIVKKMKACNKDFTLDSKELADNDKTPLTIWVDKTSKEVVKVAGHTTQQDEQKEHMKGTFEVTFTYGQAEINKPDGAKPIMEVLGDISSLFGLGGNPSGLDSFRGSGGSTEGLTDECLTAYQEYVNTSGAKPIPVQCQ